MKHSVIVEVHFGQAEGRAFVQRPGTPAYSATLYYIGIRFNRITMKAGIPRKILSYLKSHSGASLYDFQHLLPEQYLRADPLPTGHLLSDELNQLISWGLVEIYQGQRLLNATEWLARSLDELTGDGEALRVYISRQALDIEDALGIRLDSPFSEVFDTIKRASSNEWPEVFVLMPFDPQMKPIYEDHIVPVVLDLQLKVGRADDFFTNGHIMNEVWTAINRASIILADCTNRNPNVFYEVGIAHAIGKKTILMTQSMDDIPFDLRHMRVIA